MNTKLMTDVFGTALLDYFEGNYTEDILTETTISEKDVLPLPYLFRSYSEMPPLEQKALQLATGKILDVGCGAGSHSLWLQENDHKVTAVDISEGAVSVARQRGVRDVRKIRFLDLSEEKFDTVLLLMNGTGIFRSMATAGKYLHHLKTLLKPKGQVLVDTSDLQYMFDSNDDGSIWVPADRYYGELEFTVTYKGKSDAPFPWLYLDERNFKKLCDENGLRFEVVLRGDHYDYLARLTALEDTLA